MTRRYDQLLLRRANRLEEQKIDNVEIVYPTLLAAISDIAHPKWRATSLGVYRFWRDLGFVFGAIGVGFIADISNSSIAIQLVAWIAIASSVFVLLIMKETRRPINKE